MNIQKQARALTALLLALTFAFSQGAPLCAAAETGYNPTDTWAIYLYMCGSDLESGGGDSTQGGAATDDLNEIMSVKLPKNIKVVIEAGGASEWRNGFDADKLNRYIYDSGGLRLLEKLPNANMGAGKTLEDFLRFCNTSYPADHKMVIFWDHGSGSIRGVARDENFDGDMLDMSEIRAALEANGKSDKTNPLYEIIGFDACLMATIDVARTLNGYTRWMVASQESESKIGWDYEGLLTALTKSSAANGGEFGKAISDTFYAANMATDEGADSCTLSVIDMSKIDALWEAYLDAGAEALLNLAGNSLVYRDIARAASDTLNYAENCMADLGDFASHIKDAIPKTSERLINALDDAVYYTVNGAFETDSHGLSFYYDYGADETRMGQYTKLFGENPFVYMLDYALKGELSEAGLKYLRSSADRLPEAATVVPKKFSLRSMENGTAYPVSVNAENHMVLNLGAELANEITDAYLAFIYMDENGELWHLGQCNDLTADWENGVFTENFRGAWGSIDGQLVYTLLVRETDDKAVYAVPCYINNDGPYSLFVQQDKVTGGYEILGARGGFPDEMAASGKKALQKLKIGDFIVFSRYVAVTDNYIAQKAEELKQLSSEYGVELSEEQLTMQLQWYADKLGEMIYDMGNKRLTVTEDTRFKEIELSAGHFMLRFELLNVLNRPVYSNHIIFQKYADVSDTTPGAVYINRLSITAIVAGYNGMFRPNDKITRAEFAVMLDNALAIKPIDGYGGTKVAGWNGVPDWAKPFAAALVEAGVIDGKIYFGAGSGISGKEMTGLCQKAYALKNPGKPAKDFTLDEVGNATRAEAAEVVCRILVG